MIGVFDYTVILTYLSLVSVATGIIVCLHGIGHPFYGIFFLMFSGLCDTFDGRVAASKPGRTQREKNFGVQIDSLSDLVAFGVLPGCIGIAMLRASERFSDVPRFRHLAPDDKMVLYPIILTLIVLVYILCAMIRLAWFNVLEEERRNTAPAGPKTFTGLPVTSAALIFPTIMLLQYITRTDITIVYFGVMLLVAILFISPIQIRKPGMRGILIMIGIGILEFILFLLFRTGVFKL